LYTQPTTTTYPAGITLQVLPLPIGKTIYGTENGALYNENLDAKNNKFTVYNILASMVHTDALPRT
jgi:hypothetical protein